MGSRAPSIHRIQVNSVGLDDDKLQMESMDLNLDIEYSGGLGIAIDVALAYGKSAFLSVKGICSSIYCSINTYCVLKSSFISLRSSNSFERASAFAVFTSALFALVGNLLLAPSTRSGCNFSGSGTVF